MAQTNRQVQAAARKRAMEVRNEMRRARLERDRRLEFLATAAQVALLERGLLVRAAEQRAGEVIRLMTEVEGLALRDAVGWIGADLTLAEARKIRRAVSRVSRDKPPRPYQHEGRPNSRHRRPTSDRIA